MDGQCPIGSAGNHIIEQARRVNLDPSLLYEAVVDLSSECLLTANSINIAAGILLAELGLPAYFFENLTKGSLKHILAAIATSIAFKDGKAILVGRVAHIIFDLEEDNHVRVRIATHETRDSMEKILEDMIAGHRREYYHSPESGYYTYIVRPETVMDFSRDQFAGSRFLFSLAGDYLVTPKSTRQRYEDFLKNVAQAVTPLIEVAYLPETDETRLMFSSDFPKPQLPVFRKLFLDHGLVLRRAYWEPYLSKSAVPVSICSMYVMGALSPQTKTALVRDVCAYLSFAFSRVVECYLDSRLTFNEMLFAGNVVDFAHLFIYKERDNATDQEIFRNLAEQDHREAFATRIHTANKAIYVHNLVLQAVLENPDLIQFLYHLFAQRFDPQNQHRMNSAALAEQALAFDAMVSSRFMDNRLYGDIFLFMLKLVTCTLKTNFYKPLKRAFAFRFDCSILDPLVFAQFVYGIFFVNGHYARGTHMRAGDIARGGLRLMRVSEATHPTAIDNAVLLNYALGPRAQRLKHKDICESGAKGVLVPHAIYAGHAMDAVYDYTEGILDLVLADEAVIDYYGKPEMIFFGPDEGTAALMDAVAERARARGYRYWRTLTTGKRIGIPHDAYGRLDNGDLFGLFDRQAQGTELQVNGAPVVVTSDAKEIFARIGNRIETSGMTTTGVMATFRTLIAHYGADEENLNLMMTGGPDGDLGANQIQCYKGKICLVIDGGSVLFDPAGLDREALITLAFSRHTSPRANTLDFPLNALSPQGFRVPLAASHVRLPDGTVVDNGALFHRNFLSDPGSRRFIRMADIGAFIPCGGLKDTVNRDNVQHFLAVFRELRFIVEGANVFFDEAARRTIAATTGIKLIKDITANKGGVFSSAIAEVLSALLLDEQYEASLMADMETRGRLIREVLARIDRNARLETGMLIRIHEADQSVPLFALSEKTSEHIFELQALCEQNLPAILGDRQLIWRVLEQYIPAVLIEILGKEAILQKLATAFLQPYRDTILTKKLASMAFYKYGAEWHDFLEKLKSGFIGCIRGIVEEVA
ncbi:MAG: NADP-specific glutamate dehydrogenase GdhA [Desulfatitalea sp. BRH_c12]|nr:MAG: NADP-specific glutamate dehydrogenase GdhA [Desulfatitalea sp. BRH_c12]